MQSHKVRHLLETSKTVLSSIRQYAKSMRGWQAHEYGSPEVLQSSSTLKIPAIRRPNDVLVKVHAASINPLDVMMLRGYGSKLIGVLQPLESFMLSSQALPAILGRDFSGTVVSTGSCVRSVKPGDEVFGVIGPQHPGSHAEYTLTQSFALTKKPSALNHVEAASIPYAGLTAWSAVSTFGNLSRDTAQGKRVLIFGGSGGVGTVAIQLLKAWGADVTATCATDAMEFVMNLGADNVIDYLSPDYLSEIKHLQKFDFVLDMVGGANRNLALDVLKTWGNGKYVTVVSPLLANADKYGFVMGNVKSLTDAVKDTMMGLKSGQSVRWAYILPNGPALKALAGMLESKQIAPVIDQVFAFDDVPGAYQKVLDGHARGKTVIDFQRQPSRDNQSEPKEQTRQNSTDDGKSHSREE